MVLRKYSDITEIMDADESFKSPELQRLEDEVKLMEEEMDAAHREFVLDNYSSPEIEYDMPEMQAMNLANAIENECDMPEKPTMNIANYGQNVSPHERMSPSPSPVPVQVESTATTVASATSRSSGYVDALRTLAFLFATIPRGLGFALVIFVFSMIAQMYPTAPQSGSYISLLLALFQVKPVSWQGKGKTHIVSLMLIVGISCIFDVDWLISNYFVESLVERNDDFEYKLTQQTSFVWQMAWWAVAVNVFVCIVAIIDYLDVWSLLRGYFGSNKIDIYKPVSQKVVLVTWIELLSSLLLFNYFFLIQSGAVSGRMNVFNEAPVQILSVQAALLFKGTSGIVAFLSLVHHIKIRDLCGQCGCRYFCVTDRRETRRNQKKIVSSMKRSLSCIAFTKAVDFVFGVMLWISLVNAELSSIQYDAPKDVKAILILMIMTNSLTSLTPLLIGSIIWSIRLAEKQREESRQEAMDQNTPHRSSRANRRAARRNIYSAESRRSIESPSTHKSAYDSYDFGSPNVRSSQSLFSTRLDAASPTPSAPPLQEHNNTQRYTPFNLDLNLYCTPQEFESEWQSLSRCSCKEEYPIVTIPTLALCNMHFNQVGWSIIASGVVEDDITKLFLIAQREEEKMELPSANTQSPRRSGTSPTTLHSSLRKKTRSVSPRCLAQLSFGGNNSIMALEMRCRQKDQIESFVGSLQLVNLFHVA